jgi:hypothetical protein
VIWIENCDLWVAPGCGRVIPGATISIAEGLHTLFNVHVKRLTVKSTVVCRKMSGRLEMGASG